MKSQTQDLAAFLNNILRQNQPMNSVTIHNIADKAEEWLSHYEDWASKQETSLNDMEIDEGNRDEKSDDECSDEDGDMYAVRRLLEFDVIGDESFYLVEWEGYPSSANSWEPSSNITQDLIDEYWEEQNRY